MDNKELRRITRMILQLCLSAGSQVSTAYTVAGLFAKGLEQEAARKG